MKANELRIGNLVTIYKSVWDAKNEISTLQWVESLVTLNLLNNIELDLFEVEPIPLTKEWLVRFGFQYRLDGICFNWHIGANPITHDWLFHLKWLGGNEYPFYMNGYHEIEYVHQLQNLYFALTGQELTLTDAP
jgi:hypothetical protein